MGRPATVSAVIPVCPLSDLVASEPIRFEPDGDVPICVVLADDGEVYAVDDICSHQEASLAEGWVEGCEIECPLHGSAFDLRTGEVDTLPATRPIRTHAVEIVDGVVHVSLSDERPNLPPGVSF
ncbi:bifunctional 3-phenylpropionate/cinnamic acid dioxygenase ferredoxin subunit [Nocardioides sp. AN3]